MSSLVWVPSVEFTTSSTKKKCCANGALPSVSDNFDEELMMRFALDEMPLYMRFVTTEHKFCQNCTKYNNLFAMAKSRSRLSLCDAEWTSSSFLYKGIQFQPAKLWFIIF